MLPIRKVSFISRNQLLRKIFLQITILKGTYEIEPLSDELKRIIIDKGHYSEDDYPFTIKPHFSTLGIFIEIKPQRAIIGFVYDDSIRNLLGFHETMSYREYNSSPNPVDIISFDNIFIESDIAKGLIFKSRRSGIIMHFTMSVSPGYKFINRFEGGEVYSGNDRIKRCCFKFLF